MRAMRQCCARDRIRSSTSARFVRVPSASLVANSRAWGSSSPSANSDQKVRARSSPRVPATSAAKSICKAHSRALRREPIISLRRVLNFELRTLISSAKYKVLSTKARNQYFRSSLFESFPIQTCQFHRRCGGLKTLIAELNSGAVDGLIDILRGNDAKQQRHARLQTGLADAARGFAGDVIKVRCLSANDHPQTNHGVKLSGLGCFQSTQRNFKRTRHAKNLDILFLSSKFAERVERAGNQTRHQRIVPATGDNPEAKALSVKNSLMRAWLQSDR